MNKEYYISFLKAVPVGMLPAIKVQLETAIDYEHRPSVQAGILTNQHIIEKMFQDIVINGTAPMVAA